MTEAMSEPTEPLPGAAGDATSNPIGWSRAILSAVVIVVVAFVGCVYGPNLVVTKITSLSTGIAADIAGALCIVAVVLLAWGLRRLQARGLI